MSKYRGLKQTEKHGAKPPSVQKYEVGDLVVYQNPLGEMPEIVKVAERFIMSEKDYEKMSKHYSSLQRGEYGYRLQTEFDYAGKCTRHSIIGKLEVSPEYKMVPNPDFKKSELLDKKTTPNGPKLKGPGL